MQSCMASRARQNVGKRVAAALVLAGSCLLAGSAEAKPYKGAEVYTQSTYKYGRIEVRMRAAKGEGVLSTFFTYKQGSELEGAAWEEIDVEVMGKSNAAAFQSNILVGNPRMGSEQVHPNAVSLAEGYHTYTVEWTPASVVWFIDGVEARRTTGGQVTQLTSLHNFRFNLWASDVASWAGAFSASVLPQYQYVNWIRYYRYENGAFVLDWSDDFNTFDTTRWSKADWTFGGNLADFDPNNAVVRDGMLLLCLTPEGQTGCSGAVPPDPAGNGGGGAGGSASGGAAGTSSGGAGGSGGMAGGAGGAAGSSGTPSGGATSIAGAGAAAGGSAGAGGTTTAMAGTASVTAGAAGTAAGGAASGGSASPSTGGGASSGSGNVTPDASDSGCGCAVVGSSKSSHAWLALALGLALRARRRVR